MPVKKNFILKVFLFLSFLMFFSCYKNHLYVQVEKIDKDFLASSHISTPDPMQEDPPYGQRVIISWSFPNHLYRKDLFVYLTVRFWDNKEALRIYKINRKWGTQTFYFSNKKREKGRKILTYQVQIVTQNKEIIEVWRHQFWTKLIDVDKEEEVLEK